MSSGHTTSLRKRRALRHPKAGEVLPVYGAAELSHSFLLGLRARERATIERALAILGAWMTEDRDVFDSPGLVKRYLQLQIGCEP